MMIFVIGAPASGKGTLCGKLCSQFNFEHLSVGDFLRRLVKTKDNRLSQQMIDRISRCELLDIEDLTGLLKAEIARANATRRRNIVIDGFPRSWEQAKATEHSLGSPGLVLFFDCPQDIARTRYMSRAAVGRDINPAVFDRRYEEYARLNAEIVEEYSTRSLLLKIDSSGDTEASYEKVLEAMGLSTIVGK